MSVVENLVPILGGVSACSALVAVLFSIRSLKKEQAARAEVINTLTKHKDLFELFSKAAADGHFNSQERREVAEALRRYLEADAVFSNAGRANESKRMLKMAVDAPTERFYQAIATEVGVLGAQLNGERA
ncbi:hypothetical protein [Ruegeria arenilitoris]|uniref:hypothetical protein n=1 Tax=Ruegeria arenilitoris TaxID=1173585 RepID=UPI001480E725|nr:hypothetical protein [Ruegeria arenilitoris]